jgi:hypothetical protein
MKSNRLTQKDTVRELVVICCKLLYHQRNNLGPEFCKSLKLLSLRINVKTGEHQRIVFIEVRAIGQHTLSFLFVLGNILAMPPIWTQSSLRPGEKSLEWMSRLDEQTQWHLDWAGMPGALLPSSRLFEDVFKILCVKYKGKINKRDDTFNAWVSLLSSG